MGMRICMLVILGFIMGIESLAVDWALIGTRWILYLFSRAVQCVFHYPLYIDEQLADDCT
jgi:hypothetical protein